MREIVMDTETTGLKPEEGHRIVEIGAVELVNLLPTGRIYHQYINPERSMPKEAERVHGLDDVFLADKPVFARIAGDFADFIGDAKLVIHNAAFDMAMINAELDRLGHDPLPMSRAVDTLDLARRRFPGAQASLDALCRRFEIDNSGREKHGALLDSELLAEVYLELMGGRQQGLVLDARPTGPRTGAASGAEAPEPEAGYRSPPRPQPLAPRISEAERAAHDAFIAELGAEGLWTRTP
ncbi:MAG: DNA polymerase III subunit epsilon [Paracoccaceae bacterium]|nr:DNA polymerase III subunit epsilon [Paracoccaceae bacterium]